MESKRQMAQNPRPSARRLPPPSGVMLRGSGRVSSVRRAPESVVCTLVGVLETAHYDWLLGELERQTAATVRHVFIDASRVEGPADPLYARLDEWLGSGEELGVTVHVLRPRDSYLPASASRKWIDHRGERTFLEALGRAD